MSGKDREVLIVTAVGAALAVLAAALSFLDDRAWGNGYLLYIFLAIWAFGAPPAYVFAFHWLKRNIGRFQNGFWLGWCLFSFCWMPAALSPVFAVLYYVSVAKRWW